MADFVISADWRAAALPRWFQAPLSWNDWTSLVGHNDWRTAAVDKRFTADEVWNDATSIVGAVFYDVRAFVYKMRGMDAEVDGLYDTWLSSSPDLRAQSYTGGLGLPLRDVCVIDVYPDVGAYGAPATKGIVMPDTLIVLRVYLTGTTPQQLTTEATPVRTTAFIKADPTNTATIALVMSGGSISTGLVLAPGDPAVAEIDDLSKLWFAAEQPGQWVAVTASQ